MGRLVFVSDELFPYAESSDGRILHNMLRAMSATDLSRTTVLLVDLPSALTSFETTFPDVSLVCLDTKADSAKALQSWRHPPRWAYSDTPEHWRSSSVFRALSRIAAEKHIEYLEFSARGGLGFCSIQERKFAGFLNGTTIALRLNTTHLARLHSQPQARSAEDFNLADIERKCLRDCDVVVAQIPSMGTATRELFSFSDDEWNSRVIQHAPPVLLDGRQTTTEVIAPDSAQVFLFASGPERRKRPDLFIRGVASFMRTRKDYAGSAIFADSVVDAAYKQQIQQVIPVDLQDRFQCSAWAGQSERQTMLASSTVIVSSEYDSFCLLAFETSLLGGRLILNGKNPAFGEGTPWRDGVNCYKFDGSAAGLATTIHRSFDDSAQLRPVELPRNSWPWEIPEQQAPSWSPLAKEPLVSIVVPHYNLGAYLPETINNILEIDYDNIEVVVVDDASTDEASARAIEAISRDNPNFKVLRLSGNVGLSGARNIGIRHSSGKYVLTLDADDLIDPKFIFKAVQALENSTDFDVVVTPAAYFVDGDAPMNTDFDAVGYALFTGEAHMAGLLVNRFSTATALFRKDVLQRFPYDESLTCYEDWSLFMRMCDSGIRFIVATEIFFYYRRRANSMVHAPRDSDRRLLEYLDFMRVSAPRGLQENSRHLVIGLSAPSTVQVAAATDAMPRIEEVVQRMALMENQLVQIVRATSPLIGLFRIPRLLWQKLRPIRRRISRLRGRT